MVSGQAGRESTHFDFVIVGRGLTGTGVLGTFNFDAKFYQNIYLSIACCNVLLYELI